MGQTIGKCDIGENDICELTSCSTLEEIETLRLSGVNLLTVNTDILQRLKNVKEIDVSNNQLSGVNGERFTMPTMKELNCSNNNFTSVDDFIIFPNLEKLDISNNTSLEVADRYKLVSLLPQLTILEQKNVTDMREAVNKFDTVLAAKVSEHWSTQFEGKRLQSDEDNNQIDLANDFVKSLITGVSIGPAALKKYREFKLTILGKDHAIKRKQQNILDIHPTKSFKSGSGILFQSHDIKPQFKSKRTGVNYAQSDYDIFQLLQTHSLNNDPKDRHTQVWACEFQPDPKNPDKTTSLCATCGGDAVCFIECSSGEVVKKYKQPGDVFYCLTWTVFPLEKDGMVKNSTALAVGGKLREIRIIQPENLVCYDSIEAHDGAIQSLHFHPSQPTWLFSAGEDGHIILCDIGLTTMINSKPKASILMKLKSPGVFRSLTIPVHGEVLISGGDKGCTVWSIINCANKKSEQPLYELNFPGKKKVPLDCVKCLSNNVIATKRVKEPCIMLYYSESGFLKNDASPAYRLPWKVTDTPFIKFNFRTDCDVMVAGDDHGRVWIYDVNQCLCESRQGKKLEELKETQILLCSNGTVKTFNHVCSSSNMNFIVAVSNSNVVSLWKRAGLIL